MSRTNNSINNSIWGIFSKIATIIMPFLVRAVIIQKLGVEYLGLNSLFTSIISVLNLTELGIGSAIVYHMYKPIANNDSNAVSALLKLYKYIYRIIGLVIVVIGILIMPMLPKLINGAVPPDINLYVLFGVYLLDIVVSYCLFGYRTSLLYACQRNDIVSKMSVLFHFLMYISQIVVLLLFKNYYAYIIFLPISSLFINVFCAYFSKKMFPEYICEGVVSKEQKKDIKKRVIGLSMNKIAYASRNAFDSIILSTFLGLATVAIYNNYYYIISSVAAILKILMTSITASIGNSLATESAEKNEKDLFIVSFLYTFISCACSCCIISVFQPFMKLWVGEGLLFGNAIMVLIVFYFMIDKMENVIGVYYDAAGMWWNGRYKGLIEAVVNLSLDILLGYLFGVVGVIIATIISILFVSIPLSSFYMYKCYFSKSAKKYILMQFFNLFICFCIIFACYFITSMIPFGNNLAITVLLLLARFLIATAISLLLFWVIFHRTNIYKTSVEWVKPRIKLFFRKG